MPQYCLLAIGLWWIFGTFFVPELDTPSIPKHVTFVLDVSGSMAKGYGEETGKITQLQDAMTGILEQLDQGDYFRSCH